MNPCIRKLQDAQDLIDYYQAPTYMSRALAVIQSLILLGSVMILSISPVLGDEHDGIIIDQIVEWSTDIDISENIYIKSNGELTISSEITFTSVAEINIEEGGALNLVENGKIVSQKRASSLSTLGVNVSKLIIPTGEVLEEMNIIVVSEEPFSLNGSKVYVNEIEELSMGGETFEIQIPEGDQDTQLSFDGFGIFPIINSIILETPTGIIINEYKASSLISHNMLLYGENGVSINSLGTIRITDNSTINGVDISSSGEIIIMNSTIKGSCPILLTTNEASLSIQNSEIIGSKDDHYVKLKPYSIIEWDNVQIKDELIDRWERIIEDQTLIFDSEGVEYSIEGTSPNGEELSIMSFSGVDGLSLIDRGGERVIEIGWFDLTVTKESATIVISEYRTGWNPAVSNISNYGPSDMNLTWDKNIDLRTLNTPFIEWVSLTITGDKESLTTGKSHQISAILANRGTQAANLYFDCDISGTDIDADIGGYQNAMIGPGEQIEVYFGWRNINPGEFGLTCDILTPTQLVNDTAFGGGTISSSAIIWEDNEEESFNMIPIFIVIIIAIISGGVYFFQKLSNDAEETAGILDEYQARENSESSDIDGNNNDS